MLSTLLFCYNTLWYLTWYDPRPVMWPTSFALSWKWILIFLRRGLRTSRVNCVGSKQAQPRTSRCTSTARNTSVMWLPSGTTTISTVLPGMMWMRVNRGQVRRMERKTKRAVHLWIPNSRLSPQAHLQRSEITNLRVRCVGSKQPRPRIFRCTLTARNTRSERRAKGAGRKHTLLP